MFGTSFNLGVDDEMTIVIFVRTDIFPPIFPTNGPDGVDNWSGGEMFSQYVWTLLYRGRGGQGTLYLVYDKIPVM